MSIDTDAILFYGFDIPVDYELPWGNNIWNKALPDSLENWLAQRAGFDTPTPVYDQNIPIGHWKTIYNSWLQAHKSAQDTVYGHSLQESDYGSDSHPIKYIYTQSVTASRGDLVRINKLPNVKPEEATALLRIAKDLGIKEPEIGWYLCSWWG